MYIADLHIHSRFSRATSGECDAPHLDLWARHKGISLVGTGDFTHPQWRKELAEMLLPEGNGLYRLKDAYRLPCDTVNTVQPRFVITGEISTIYKRDGKTRKVHHVIILPGLEAAEALAHRLEAIGNLHSDGRPILGLDSRDLLEITLEACPEAIYIPAHIWTPHFSLFGAFSGFDSMEECFGDLTPHVHALETGLSSDPPMNRRLSALDGHVLVSNSDAHSPQKLGREANLLSCEMGFSALKRALDTGDGFGGTIEFYPEEGKYHLDGHRNCQCRLTPEETRANGGVCPVCGKKVTIGVLYRVEELADRPEPQVLDKPFESLIPLPELLGETLGVSAASKKTQAAYFDLLQKLGPEFSILRERSIEDIQAAGGFLLGEAVRRLRAGQVIRQGGYDGEYGVIRVFQPGERETLLGQTTLLSGVPLAEIKKAEPLKPAAIQEETAASAPDMRPNAEQEAAIHAEENTVAVIAGPGTGKTGTLVNRIAWLIEERAVSPKEITAVTFTRQAAHEMVERLEKRLGKKRVKGLTVGTFHAICLNLIEKKPLISREAVRDVIAEILRECGEMLPPADALALISARKNGLDASGLPEGLLERYQEKLSEMGARDLDDILAEALKIPVQDKPCFHYLLVDEYQDINGVQRSLVRHWSENGRLFVIGDPDQSIYGFRGADAGCFDALLSDRPEARIIHLKQNYRSAPDILRCALTVIDRNPGDRRELAPTVPAGEPVRLVQAADEQGQYIWIAKEIARLTGGVDMLEASGGERARYAFSEITVLCRTHRQLEQAERCLRHDSIPCAVSGRGDFLEQPVNQAILGFFIALEEPNNLPALRAALKGLWHCPDGLIDRAEAAMGLTGEAFEAVLAPFDGLTPFLDAVKKYAPLLPREKPRKLLEALANDTGVKGKAVEQLWNTAVFFDTMPAFLSALRMGEEGDVTRLSGGKPSGAVRLMTLHGAKGLEFPCVFLAGLDEGRFPAERQDAETNMEEERRLLFVGLTRAKNRLILTCGSEPSPFLDELPAGLRREDAGIRPRQAESEQISFFL
ncbi:MAG: UvrD-helicase domain-containing protein [Clostridia bacterium]|nr:UvrD-helicase domain-containing protein [Clostridia bacterium]